MLDALLFMGMIAFFGFLIYCAVIQPPKKAPAPLPPSPVGLFCSLCHAPAGVVNYEEYMRISGTSTPVYCEWCVISIEAYKRQQARRTL